MERDFVDIMNDYHSGDTIKKTQATQDACDSLKGCVFDIIVSRYPTYTKDIEDLVQCGYLGIITGMQNYDPKQSMPTTHFYPYIKNQIADFINVNRSKMTIHFSSANKKIQAVITAFEKAEQPYTDIMLADATGLPLVTVRNVLAIRERASKEASVYDTSAGGTSVAPSPEDELANEEQTEMITKALKELNPVESKVICMSFGLGGYEPSTFKQISHVLNMPVAVLKNTYTRALNKMAKSDLAKFCRDSFFTDWLEEDMEYIPPEDNFDTMTDVMAEIVF